MFFSIIIPVYNCEKYLRDCLDSCINQDLLNDEYEVLCVNDGSTDSSINILYDYANRYSQIKVFSQENQGVSAARNVGLENAKGEYIMFVDGDDLIRRDILGKLKELIVESNCERLSMGGFIGNSKAIENTKDNIPEPNNIELKYVDLLWLCVFKRRIIEKYHIRFINGITHSEDVLFLNDYKNYCSDVFDFSETVYYYRIHSGSAVDRNNIPNLIKMIRSYIKIVVICKERMGDSSYNISLNYEFWNRHMAYLMRYISELPYSKRREMLSELKASKPYLPINKSNKKRLGKSLKNSIKRSNMLRRFEVTIYANLIGAHLISVRRKLEKTALGYFVKHPRRFLKNPIGFMRTARIKTNIINHRK